MCLCQAYGKSGVPNPRGYCLVCGEAVWTDAEAVIDAVLDAALDGVQRAQAAQAAVDALGAGRPRYVCPRCGAVSHNPHDAEHRYCGRCHQFEDPT